MEPKIPIRKKPLFFLHRQLQIASSQQPSLYNGRKKATMEANVLENEPSPALFVPDDDPLLFCQPSPASDKSIWWKAGIFTSRSTPLCGKRPAMLRQECHRSQILHQRFIRKRPIVKSKNMKKDNRNLRGSPGSRHCSAAGTLHDVQKDRCRRTSPDASERIIARLLKERFIDESRYTRFFVNDKLRFNK